MKGKHIFSLLLLTGVLSSCDLLQLGGDGSLSEDEIVEGLKTALVVGTDSSTTILSATNGYYADAAIKILFPDQADNMIKTIAYIDQIPALKSLLGEGYFTKQLQKTELALNRAAESAATKATPIFKSAITRLSISDGLTILNGTNPAGAKSKSTSAFDSTAATSYLKSTTYAQLVDSFSTPIDAVLNQKVGELGVTPNEAWNTLVTNYNKVAVYAQQIAPFSNANTKAMLQQFAPITDVSLGKYVTGKALDGLFVKVGEQEKSIRRDPWKWISDTIGSILQKVFGANKS
jgi:hypothetical protein